MITLAVVALALCPAALGPGPNAQIAGVSADDGHATVVRLDRKNEVFEAVDFADGAMTARRVLCEAGATDVYGRPLDKSACALDEALLKRARGARAAPSPRWTSGAASREKPAPARTVVKLGEREAVVTTEISSESSAAAQFAPGTAPAAASMAGTSWRVSVSVDGDVKAGFVRRALGAGGEDWRVDASLQCSDKNDRCVLVVIDDEYDAEVHVSAPFRVGPSDAGPLAVDASACAGRPRVSVVAQAARMMTDGVRIAALLERAGCAVDDVGESKAARKSTVLFAKKADAARLAPLARALGGTVEPLTWKTPAQFVVAVGAP